MTTNYQIVCKKKKLNWLSLSHIQTEFFQRPERRLQLHAVAHTDFKRRFLIDSEFRTYDKPNRETGTHFVIPTRLIGPESGKIGDDFFFFENIKNNYYLNITNKT